MNEWKEFKKEHYQQKYSITYGQGMIDFAPESMDDVRGGSFRSYDEYLDVQKNSCGQSRRYFELAYYAPAMDMHFRGTIDRVNSQPAYYSGNTQEALMRMIGPEKPRIYIE